MKLLYVSEAYPWPLTGGGIMRHYHLIRGLSQQHDVTLLSLMPPTLNPDFPPSPIESLCSEVISLDFRTLRPLAVYLRYHPYAPIPKRITNALFGPWSMPGARWSCREIVDAIRPVVARGFDAIWADQSYIAEAVWYAGGRRLVADVDDVLWTMQQRELAQMPAYQSKPLHYLEMVKLSLYERSLPRWIDRLVLSKDADRRYFSGNPNHIHVIPNGYDAVARADASHEDPYTLLFVGSLDYAPNQVAVKDFVRDIFPLVRARVPAAKFCVVGKDPPQEILALDDGSAIRVHATVPSTLPYYERAAVCVSPLQLGGGTKLKVLEAILRGLPLVATPVSMEGIPLEPGRHFELATSADEFAVACVTLLNDTARRARLRDTGAREILLAEFDWDRIGAKAAAVVETLHRSGSP